MTGRKPLIQLIPLHLTMTLRKLEILFTLFTLALLGSCSKPSIQDQLDEKFGKYVEEVGPGDKELFKAYNKALKLWKIPFGEVYIKTSFGKAHVLVSGPENGEALVLLHGMNASSTMWYPNIKALSENHRVYAIDYLKEPGKSQLKGEVDDMEEVMQWYTEVFEGMQLKEFGLIGASKGGWQAVHLAIQHKHPIKKLILLSPAQTFTLIKPGSDMITNLAYTLNPKRKNLREVLQTMTSDVDNIKQEYIDQYFIATKKASIDKLMLKMLPYSKDELRSVKVPVLVMIGDEDIINDEKSIEKAKELMPNCTTEIIKKAGHFLSIDQSETVNQKMLEFLNAKEKN